RAVEQLGDPWGEDAAERPAAADHVLPQPALGLVQAERFGEPERRTLKRRRGSGLVESVAAFVHRAIQGRREERLIPTGPDPDVAGAKPGRERMDRVIE